MLSFQGTLRALMFGTLVFTVLVIQSAESQSNNNSPETSLTCQGRCNSRFNKNNKCQCNTACSKFKDCCGDFNSLCKARTAAQTPSTSLSCQGRCNSKYNKNNKCQCNTACPRYNNCCGDFNSLCTAGTGAQTPSTSLSCQGRCKSKYNPQNKCQCNTACSRYNNCCDDFNTLCKVNETERYFCKGQCNVTRERCDCRNTCLAAKNCCADYQETCLNKLPWSKEACNKGIEQKCPAGFEIPPVILFSIDGFKAEYLYRELTPNIHKLASCGVHVPYMRSVYPTKTFPNHYTIATGLYPESSGIVGNVMIDRVLRKKFRLGNQESFQPYWWKGEPIWVTASNQGLKSATYFWPGSDVNITRYPDYYFKYDGSVPNEERMYQALDWLDLPTGQRPSFITLYISILDSAGHKYGPVRSGFDKTLKTADTMVGILMNGLRDRGLLNCVNIIMLADHGMSPVKCSRLTSIEKFGVDASKYFVKSGSAGRVGSNLDPVAEASYNVTQVYEKLKCKRKEAHWQAFLKDEYLPKRFHYANNQRIDDVILLMDDTYLVEGKKGSYTKCDGGSHGFDPEFASMHALFAAHGPGFKQNYNSTEPFENIEVYNLMADLLNITAAPNNGTKGSMYHVMRSPPSLNLTFPVDGATGPCWVVPWESDCANCSKTNSTKVNQRLYLSDQQISSTLAKHLPLGVTKQPYTSDCFFYQQNYVTMLETPPQMPLFTSFVLNRSKPGLEVSEVCDRCDPRYHDEFVISKNFQNVATTTYLYQPGFTSGTEQNDASISTNRVPIYKNSVKIWNYMMETVGNWSYFHGETLVMLGPAFDYDHNGISDDYDLLACFRLPCDVIDAAPGIPMPTHYYIIVAYCSHSGMSIANCTSSPDDVEVLSFIIPNFKDKPCYAGDEPDEVWISQTVIEHVARVRDVELITDINFFEDWTTGPLADQNTATASVRLKNRLPQFTDKLLVDFVKISKNMSTQLKSTLFAFVVSVFASIVSLM